MGVNLAELSVIVVPYLKKESYALVDGVILVDDMFTLELILHHAFLKSIGIAPDEPEPERIVLPSGIIYNTIKDQINL